MEETLKKVGTMQHLKLATMTKPGIHRQGYSGRIHDDSSEEEMTQMSCGRNIKDNFHATGTSSNLLITSRSGMMLSSHKMPEAMQPLTNAMLSAENQIDATLKKKKTGPEFNSLRQMP